MAKSKSGNLFVWIAVGILTFGMIGFGATGLSGRIDSIGTVGNLEVPVTSYANELQSEISAVSAQTGTAVSFAQAQSFGIPQQALATVIRDRVFDNELERVQISAGDDVVLEEIMGTPAFRGPDGNFSREQYKDRLSRAGLTEAEYESSVRDGASRSILQGAVLAGVPEPRDYAVTVATWIGERRDFTWGKLRTLESPLAEPTDADTQAQYDATPEAYTSPLIKVVTYAWLTPEMIQDSVTVDEAELRAAYDERINEFVQPERRLVERLVFPDDAAAESALAAISDGTTDFDTAVEDRGLNLTDIDLGDVAEGDLGAAGEAVFAADPGEVVGPFPTNLGPALFRMNAILAAQEITFAQAIPELREERAAARARRIIEDQIDPINDLLAGGARLEDLADQTDMELATLDWSADTETGIAAYAEFRDAVADMEPGAYPELKELEDGGIFAMRVDEIRQPALRPLDEVRDQVITDWTEAETLKTLRANAQTLAETITPDSNFEELGLTGVLRETDLTRRDFLTETPPGFMDTVFEMETGDVSVIDNGDHVIVVRLDNIAPPPADDAAVTAQTEAIARNTSEAIALDLYGYFAQALQLRTDIQINDQALNAVHANFR